jgi:hypothetical protein
MRLTLDLLLGRPLPDAVAGLDAVLRHGLVDRAHLAERLASARTTVSSTPARPLSSPIPTEDIVKQHLGHAPTMDGPADGVERLSTGPAELSTGRQTAHRTSVGAITRPEGLSDSSLAPKCGTGGGSS